MAFKRIPGPIGIYKTYISKDDNNLGSFSTTGIINGLNIDDRYDRYRLSEYLLDREQNHLATTTSVGSDSSSGGHGKSQPMVNELSPINLKAQRKTKQARPAPSRSPVKPPIEEVEQETHWIEIELVDEDDDEPISNEQYELTLPNGKVEKGTTDQNGCARFDGIDPGTCQLIFPKLDKALWE